MGRSKTLDDLSRWGRTAKLENDIRQQIENAAIAVENAHQAYAAAVESRNYQQQLLQAEIDKFAVGASTNFMIVQDQSYLAQARSPKWRPAPTG